MSLLTSSQLTFTDLNDGSSIWTTTTAPTTPNYTFTISNLSGPDGIPVKIGDIIIYSYYRYVITSVSDTTAFSATGVSIRGSTGAAGSKWYSGTAITGTSTTGTIFSGSGISSAVVNDQYLNTSTGNTYICTTAGAATVAKWQYTGNIKGQDGENAISLTLYSSDGTSFTDDINQITIETYALDGASVINGGSYVWYYYDSDNWITIDGKTESTLTVNADDVYALRTIKCSMEYNGNTYTGYISLNKTVDIYTSEIKFFDNADGTPGSYILSPGCDYIVAYVNVYKNGVPIDGLITGKYATISNYNSSATFTSQIPNEITTKVDNGFSVSDDNNAIFTDYVYFICKSGSQLELILGKYTRANTASSGTWSKVDDIESLYNYKYYNDYTNNYNKVFIIEKSKIGRTKVINVFVQTKQEESVSNTNITIVDLNDPIVSNTAPSNPKDGQIWIDTSSGTNVMKVYNDSYGDWVVSTQTKVHTSTPTSYNKGDVWVLGEDYYGGENLLIGTKEPKVFSSYTSGYFIKIKDGANSTYPSSCLTLSTSSDTPHGYQLTVKSTPDAFPHYLMGYNGGLNGLSIGGTYTMSCEIKNKFSSANVTNVNISLIIDGTQHSLSSVPAGNGITYDWTRCNFTFKIPSGTQKLHLFIKANNGDYTNNYSVGDYFAFRNIILVEGSTPQAWHQAGEQIVYTAGTILTAQKSNSSFDMADWALSEESNNTITVKQYFEFTSDDGLKIGQKETKENGSVEQPFYVQITASEMGFYDNQDGDPIEVVSIGNNAAQIRDATFEGTKTVCKTNVDFQTEVNFVDGESTAGFTWKIEDNGSLSLAIKS